jgi:hypothetical protein
MSRSADVAALPGRSGANSERVVEDIARLLFHEVRRRERSADDSTLLRAPPGRIPEITEIVQGRAA